MRRAIFVTFAVLFVLACNTVPITGRKQLSLVSDKEVLTLSFQQYDEFMKNAPISNDAKSSALVINVGRKLAVAVEEYMKSKNSSSQIKNFQWTFNLVKSDEVNAFCMPGGKIVVYEGILKYTQDELGLATVLSHEIAHAVAKHAQERMSQQVAASAGAGFLTLAMDKQSELKKQAAMLAYGLGAQYAVMLPYSREHEYEADRLGAVFMAMAGYDPRNSVDFWRRMSSKSGSKTPAFMSTHPSDEKRIQNLQNHMSEAMKYYKSGH